MKIKDMEMNYIHLEAEPEAVQRRVEASFDILFDSVFGGIKDFQHIHKSVGNEGENDDRKIALPISA